MLFVVAATIRLLLLHTARFGGDEALFFGIGMDIVEFKSWPLLGTQITDGAARLPGPAFLYLMALPLVVARAPEAQYAFVELLGAVTVVVFWAALRRPYGERGAFVAAMFMACSPWATLYADRTWNPNVMPFFVVTAMWCAWQLRQNPRSRSALVWWPLLAVLPQLHMSAPVAWAGLVVLAGRNWLDRSALRERRREHAIGLLLALALYVPLLVHELGSDFGNTRRIFAETVGRVGGERHPWGFVWVPVYAARFLTLDVTYQELTGYWGGPNEWKNLAALFAGTTARPMNAWRATGLGASFIVLVVVVVTALRSLVCTRRFGPAGAAVVVAVIANMVLMGVAAKQVFGHYVTNLVPFVLTGVAVVVAHTSSRVVRRGFLVAVVLTGIVGIEATLSISRGIDAKIGLGVHRCVTQAIVDDAATRRLAQTEPVHLGFIGVRSSLYDWHIFATRAANAPLHFDKRAPRRRFVLTPAGAPAPKRNSGAPIDCGAAVLWAVP